MNQDSFPIRIARYPTERKPISMMGMVARGKAVSESAMIPADHKILMMARGCRKRNPDAKLVWSIFPSVATMNDPSVRIMKKIERLKRAVTNVGKRLSRVRRAMNIR